MPRDPVHGREHALIANAFFTQACNQALAGTLRGHADTMSAACHGLVSGRRHIKVV
jgi:hypothetical protein